MTKPALLKVAALCIGITLGYGYARLTDGVDGLSPYEMTRASDRSPVSSADDNKSPQDGEASQLKTIFVQQSEREAIWWLRSRCERWSSAHYATAAADLVAVGSQRTAKILGELLENWALKSPLEAVAFLDTLPRHQMHDFFPPIAVRWAEVDPEGLLAWAKRQDDRHRFGAAVNALATHRPEEAIRLIAETPPLYHYEPYGRFNGVLSTLVANDPQRAIQLFSTLPEKEQQLAISDLFMSWNENDPVAAQAWIASLPSGPLREHGFGMIVHALSLTAPKEAAQMAMREMTTSEASKQTAFSLVYTWMERNPSEAREFFLKQADSPFKRIAMETVEREWAMREPIAFLDELIDKQDFSESATRWISMASRALVRKDPDAFAQWFEKNREEVPPERLSSMISGAASHQPQLAGKLLAMLPEGQDTDYAFELVAAEWAGKDLEGARGYLSTLPAGNSRDRFENALIGSLAKVDLPAALKEAEMVTDPARRPKLLNHILQRSRSFAEIASWAVALPAGPDTPTLAQNVVTYWARHDVKSSGEWIATLPEGAAKQAAIRTYANEIALNEPTDAIQWATKIDDAKQREKTLADIATRWSMVDKAAAAAWVAKSPLPDEVKKRFTSAEGSSTGL